MRLTGCRTSKTLRQVCAFLWSPEGTRWRHSVYLNTERMLREDSGSVGATALLICLIAHRWVERGEEELHRLFEGFWQKRTILGSGLTQLAELAAESWPESVAATYWRARLVHAEDIPRRPELLVGPAAASRVCRGRLSTRPLPPSRRQGTFPMPCWRHGHGTDVEEAENAYGALPQVELCSSDVLLDEAAAILDAEGTEPERAETFVGLLLAAYRRGADRSAVVDLLDTGWSQEIETCPLRYGTGPAADRASGPAGCGWPLACPFLRLPGPKGIGIAPQCNLNPVRSLPGARRALPDADRDRIAAALCRIDPQQLQPPHAGRLLIACAARIDSGNAGKYAPLFARAGPVALGWWANADPITCTALLGDDACAAAVPCAALEHLWTWAIEHQRADVVRSLCLLHLTPEGQACRKSLLERLMLALLNTHRQLL